MSSAPAGATPIGRNLSRFKVLALTKECLISAHRGHERERHLQVPAGVTVPFYAPHGFMLLDPGAAVLNARIDPNEPIAGPGPCHDYLLSKHRGREHDRSGESYDTIATRIRTTAEARMAEQGTYMKAAASGDPAWKLDSIRQRMSRMKEIDIATIRNRVGEGDMLLSALIRQDTAAFPSLTVFHASFCRTSQHSDVGLSHKASMDANHFV